MGLDYSFKLYTQRDKIPQMLTAVAGIATPYVERQNIPFILNDGTQILLPFSSNFKMEPVSIPSGIGEIKLKTSLVFPLDEALYQYCVVDLIVGQEPMVVEIDGCQYGYVGTIYLTITTGNKYVELSFTAATSRMSKLFLASTSIQSTFQKLLSQTNGILGIIDIEEDEYLVLGDLNRTISIDFEGYIYDDEKSLLIDIDRWTEALLSKLNI